MQIIKQKRMHLMNKINQKRIQHDIKTFYIFFPKILVTENTVSVSSVWPPDSHQYKI